MTRRILRGLAAAALLVALSAGAVSAGGWATIKADATNPPQPNAGEPFTFGFTVLQHGVTPAGWVETPTFLGINGTTGERVEIKAAAEGADGHFVATVTIPSAGYWTWQVVLTDLLVETSPQPIAIATADGTLPSMDARSMLAAIERVRSEMRTEYQAQLFSETDAMRTKIAALESRVTYLDNQRASLKKQVDGLAAGPAAATAPTPATTDAVPLVAIIGIAVLAGAISGFAITMLGRSPRPISVTSDGAIEDLAPAGGALTTR
jgi:hypothetical protein